MRDNPARIHEIEDVAKSKKITKQDVKRWVAYTILTGTLLGSVNNFGKYAFKPRLDNELNVLRGASSYLRSYEDNDPTKALIYTKFSLETVENNKNMKGVKSLEDEVSKVENDIKTSTNKLIFKPVLDYIANRMDDLASYNNPKRYLNLLNGIALFLTTISGGVMFYGFGFFDKEKK